MKKVVLMTKFRVPFVLLLAMLAITIGNNGCVGETGTPVPDTIKIDVDVDTNIPDIFNKPDIFTHPDVVEMADTNNEEVGTTCNESHSETFGKPCVNNNDCNPGWCVHGPDGDVCTDQCLACCPEGWLCRQVALGGQDLMYACVYPHITLCRPCSDTKDCKDSFFSLDVRCQNFGPEKGSFCLSACSDMVPCPDGYACKAVDGAPAGQNFCTPEAGACECSRVSKMEALSTPCEITNAFGTCKGTRTCGENGLTECDANIPAMEICDKLDNNCNGETDEGFSGTEVCNGKDDDCDGLTDEEDAEGCKTYYLDADKDGHGTYVDSKCLCGPEGKYTSKVDDDCDDSEPTVYPGATEACDGLDNDCDKIIDPPGSLNCDKYYKDADNDGWGDNRQWKCLCKPEGEYSTVKPDDCDDSKASIHPEADEECNLIDDDCDGKTDDNADKPCYTDCGNGTQACLNGVLQPCDAPKVNKCVDYTKNCEIYETCGECMGAPSETCNGADDDCNSQTDEGFGFADWDGTVRNVGDICGTGACSGGVVVCSEDGTEAVCSTATKSDQEVCDGLDNDCDGITDAGDADLATEACEVQDGVCKGAEKTASMCEDGKWSECDNEIYAAYSKGFEPVAEVTCDGLDNDCDGLTDEDLGTTTCGNGECKHTINNCVDGQVRTCDPFEGKTDEICDGLDNDCDGITDNGLGTQECGVGECKHTVNKCENGQPMACDPFEGKTDEICDNKDNDCDGDTDEDLGTTTCGKGECHHTINKCINGQSQTCDPFKGKTDEICDGIDNDCDGDTDEDFVYQGLGLGRACDGIGACGPGSVECSASKQKATCSTNPDGTAPEATKEICDGLDNDCDGLTDEDLGITTCGKGVCHHTVNKCKNGQTQTCNDFEGSSSEVCDGLDNDCDGDTDEDLGSTTCGKGECHHTINKCVNGQSQTCNAYEGSSSETCDNKDNDCDGDTDEGLTQSCSNTNGYGTCYGTKTCSFGQWGGCTARTPAAETCNNVDDNCNGTTDEGLGSTTCGKGECRHTINKCKNGQIQNCDPYEGARSEICDGLDNDCDGDTDEDLGSTTCGKGECHHTINKCVNGQSQTCNAYEGSSSETCDNKDNDCDGDTDEGLTQSCSNTNGYGTCYGTKTCSFGQWGGCTARTPAAETCNNVDDNCNGTTDEGFGGQNQPCCQGSCDYPYTCSGGTCVCSSTYGTTCYNGNVYWKDCHGNPTSQKESCPCGCSGNTCLNNSQHSYKCVNGDVYWQDCYGKTTSKKEECSNCSCNGNTCVVTDNYSYTCMGGPGSYEVWWMNCKMVTTHLKEDCGTCDCISNQCKCPQPSYTIDGCTGSHYVSGCSSYCQGCTAENGFTAYNKSGCGGYTCFTRYPNNGYNGFVVMYARSSSETAYVEWVFPQLLSGNYQIWADIPSYSGLPSPYGCSSWNPVTNAYYHVKTGSGDIATKTVNLGAYAGSSVLLYQGNATGVAKVTLGNRGNPGSCGHFLIDRVRAVPY